MIWLGAIAFDPETRLLTSAAGRKRLGKRQARVLAALIKHPGIVSRETLYETAVDDDELDPPEPKVIEVTICKMRPVLAPHGIQIKPVYGAGYQLIAPGRVEICPVCGRPIE